MGCASSAALPFLTNKESEAVTEAGRINGLNMMNNALKENGIESVKDVNESYITEKMKEVMDSSVIQDVIGGVVQKKDEIANQVKGVGEAITEKVSSVVNGVESNIEATFDKLTRAVGSIEEKVKSEVSAIENDVQTIFHEESSDSKDSIKPEDIDELLDALPTEEEITDMAKSTAEEAVNEATEEVMEETSN